MEFPAVETEVAEEASDGASIEFLAVVTTDDKAYSHAGSPQRTNSHQFDRGPSCESLIVTESHK